MMTYHSDDPRFQHKPPMLVVDCGENIGEAIIGSDSTFYLRLGKSNKATAHHNDLVMIPSTEWWKIASEYIELRKNCIQKSQENYDKDKTDWHEAGIEVRKLLNKK